MNDVQEQICVRLHSEPIVRLSSSPICLRLSGFCPLPQHVVLISKQKSSRELAVCTRARGGLRAAMWREDSRGRAAAVEVYCSLADGDEPLQVRALGHSWSLMLVHILKKFFLHLKFMNSHSQIMELAESPVKCWQQSESNPWIRWRLRPGRCTSSTRHNRYLFLNLFYS